MLVLCLLAAGTSSCVARRRMISRASNAKPLLTADMPALLDAVRKQFDTIQNFSATVDMVVALGSTETNHITEYKDFRAYIRFRRPADIRLVGLLPVVRSTMFDMVSNGVDFKLYIPSKNLFAIGRNEITQLSSNKIENLRPQHFLDALVVQPLHADTDGDKVALANFTDEDNAYYILHEIHQDANGALKLRRTVWFSRIDMTLARQMIFDDNGNPVTDARYSQWHPYDNVPFPKHIEINRPRDEYAVVLDIVKMDINKGIKDEQFVLEQPEGTTLKRIGEPSDKGTQK